MDPLNRDRTLLLHAKLGFPQTGIGLDIDQLELMLEQRSRRQQRLLQAYPTLNTPEHEYQYFALLLDSEKFNPRELSYHLPCETESNYVISKAEILDRFKILIKYRSWSFLPELKPGMLFGIYNTQNIISWSQPPPCYVYVYCDEENNTVASALYPSTVEELPAPLLFKFNRNLSVIKQCYQLRCLRPKYIDFATDSATLDMIVELAKPYKNFLDLLKLLANYGLRNFQPDSLIGIRSSDSLVNVIPEVLLYVDQNKKITLSSPRSRDLIFPPGLTKSAYDIVEDYDTPFPILSRIK